MHLYQRELSTLVGRPSFHLCRRQYGVTSVEWECGAVAVGFGLSVAAPFGWRYPGNLAIAPFPHPSHRTERAQLAHSALGQGLRPSPTEGYERATGAIPVRAPRESTLGASGVHPYCPPCVSRITTGVADTRCTGQSPGRHQRQAPTRSRWRSLGSGG